MLQSTTRLPLQEGGTHYPHLPGMLSTDSPQLCLSLGHSSKNLLLPKMYHLQGGSPHLVTDPCKSTEIPPVCLGCNNPEGTPQLQKSLQDQMRSLCNSSLAFSASLTSLQMLFLISFIIKLHGHESPSHSLAPGEPDL